ncbi:hypothetical protein BKA69DRAFT_1084805, partial [Paraphysoderma sedebokerense]
MSALPSPSIVSKADSLSPGRLQHDYTWAIHKWTELRPLVESVSPVFWVDNLPWILKLYKGRQKNSQALSVYLGVHNAKETKCLRGLKKKVAITFVVQNARNKGLDYIKVETPVWFTEKHSTWGDEHLMNVSDLVPYIKDDTLVLVCKFQVLQSECDAQVVVESPIASLINNPQFSDVSFLVRPYDSASDFTQFHCHKAILASSSPVFSAMLTSAFKESFEQTITLYYTDPDAFGKLLKWIYTQNADFKDVEDAQSCLEVADRFQILPMREECLRYLRLEISSDTIWSIWSIAVKFHCERTTTLCMKFVQQNFEDLIAESAFTRKPHDYVIVESEILHQVLSLDDLNISEEEKIFEFLLRWVTCGVEHTTSPASTSSKVTPDTVIDDLSISIPALSIDSERGKDIRLGVKTTSPKRSRTVSESLTEAGLSVLTEDYTVNSSGCSMSLLEERRLAMQDLLKCVRFPMMNKRYLVDVVEKNEMIMSILGMKDL